MPQNLTERISVKTDESVTTVIANHYISSRSNLEELTCVCLCVCVCVCVCVVPGRGPGVWKRGRGGGFRVVGLCPSTLVDLFKTGDVVYRPLFQWLKCFRVPKV